MGTPQRDRSGSVGTKDDNIFLKSRRTERSPIPKRKEPDNMEDEVLKTLLEIRNEMKEMRKENLEMRNEIKEIRKENANLQTEIQENAIGMKSLTDDIKKELEQWKEKEQIWKGERKEMEKRIENLETKEERKERAERKNNIILKGKEFDIGNLTQNIEDFFKKELQLEIQIEEAYKIRHANEKEWVLIKTRAWEDKKRIMKNKYKLKGEKIYIDNDLTVKERLIQKKLKEIAENEKKKETGHKLDIKKLKSKING